MELSFLKVDLMPSGMDVIALHLFFLASYDDPCSMGERGMPFVWKEGLVTMIQKKKLCESLIE